MLFDDFLQHIAKNSLKNHATAIREILEHEYRENRHGEFDQWMQVYKELPDVGASTTVIGDTVSVVADDELPIDTLEHIEKSLRVLHPWRKGPFSIFDIFIDTEWRSDWKWQRISPHIGSLENKMVLDVGCGSGYHCWRMLGDGARFVMGIDPSWKFLAQFLFLKKYLGPDSPVYLLPLKSEDLPANMQRFDTVFSMGVLYHRKSPFEHLAELKDALKPGGQLVLETLVIVGEGNEVLVPGDRYAQMRNVWFIPSVNSLCGWLARAGFKDIKVADVTVTTMAEQRKTDWMNFHSLEDYLDPEDNRLTVEGYPAPVRATLIARKP